MNTGSGGSKKAGTGGAGGSWSANSSGGGWTKRQRDGDGQEEEPWAKKNKNAVCYFAPASDCPHLAYYGNCKFWHTDVRGKTIDDAEWRRAGGRPTPGAPHPSTVKQVYRQGKGQGRADAVSELGSQTGKGQGGRWSATGSTGGSWGVSTTPVAASTAQQAPASTAPFDYDALAAAFIRKGKRKGGQHGQQLQSALHEAAMWQGW